MRQIALAVALALMTGTCALGQPGRGEKYAFLVVCSKYNSTYLRDLPYTIDEMQDFRQALIKSGFEADNIVLLHDKAERERIPFRHAIEKQFRLLLNGLRADDTIVVALNGHGVHYKGDKVGYYCPLGADLKDKKSLVPMDFFYELLKKSKARQKLMIVQACQDDPFVSNDFAAAQLEFMEKCDEVPEGIAAIFSCMEGQKSYYDPNRKRGLFFDHVIRAWGGEYLPDGTNKLDIEEFFRQVRVKTKADALKFRGGVPQVPEVRREYKGEWLIRGATYPPSIGAKNELGTGKKTSLINKDWKTLLGGRWQLAGDQIKIDGGGTGFSGKTLCLARRQPKSLPYELSDCPIRVVKGDLGGHVKMEFSICCLGLQSIEHEVNHR